MREISRRVRRLEDRLGLVDTEDARRGRELVDTLHRRIAARRGRGDWQGPDPGAGERKDFSGMTVVEILRHRPWHS